MIEVTVGLRPLSTNTSLRPGLQLDGRSGRPGLINRSVAPLLWGCFTGVNRGCLAPEYILSIALVSLRWISGEKIDIPLLDAPMGSPSHGGGVSRLSLPTPFSPIFVCPCPHGLAFTRRGCFSTKRPHGLAFTRRGCFSTKLAHSFLSHLCLSFCLPESFTCTSFHPSTSPDISAVF